MKTFIFKTFVFIFIVVVISALYLSISFVFRDYKTKKISWKLDSSTHILFMGASHIEKGINDSLFEGGFNLASGSERYLFTYLKLKEVLNVNQQIDTLFLQFSPTDIWENTDIKYYEKNEMSHFLPLYCPFFTKEEWTIYFSMNKKDVSFTLASKLLKKIPKEISSFGRFKPNNKIFQKENKYSMPDWSAKRGYDINYSYLYKIIDICNRHNIKIIFLYMPMYNPNEFYNQEMFYNAYDSLFSNIKFLDYSKWECNDSLRADEHHLNKLGADVFTRKLLEDIR